MDTLVKPALCMHQKDGTIMKFIEYSSRLYYFDTQMQDVVTNNSSKRISAYSFVATIAENKSYFHRRDIEAAD